MTNNDKTIMQLTALPINGDVDVYKNDLYLVSHPMIEQTGPTPRDYVTYNIKLSNLADLIISATYETLSGRISNDLSLGALAHENVLSNNKQVGNNVICMDINVHPNTYGPLASPTKYLTNISDENNDVRNNLGFKDLAFKDEVELRLSDLAHRNNILSSHISEKIPSALIDVKFKNLCLSGVEDLGLSVLAYQNTVRPNQVEKGLSITQLVSAGNGGWQPVFDNRYLSSPTTSTKGSIAVGYKTNNANRNYALSIDSVGNGFVTVPWMYSDHYTSCSLSRKNGTNKLQFSQSISSITENSTQVLTNKSIEVDVTPIINNNLTGTGSAGTVAIFSGNNSLSAGAKLSGSVKTKFYRADGVFENIPLADSTTYGLVKTDGAAKRLAVFSGNNSLSSGAELSNSVKNMYYRADGTFEKIPTATSTSPGIVQTGYSLNGNNVPVSISNGNLYVSMPTASNVQPGIIKTGFTKTDNNFPVQVSESKAFVNVPQATTTAPGIMKVGFTRSGTSLPVQLSNGNAFVDVPYADANLPGTIRLGATRANGKLPVELDDQKRAYVTLMEDGGGSGSSSGGSVLDTIAANILKTIYPVGAIYLTVAATCPLNIYGMSWTKVQSKGYLLTSGELARNESFAAGAEVAAGLPNHTHDVSFRFSSSSSKEGYPHHGGTSSCNHSSYGFTTTGASGSIYGASGTVRPRAYVVNVFRRDA